jgi:ankyrin repeat protein
MYAAYNGHIEIGKLLIEKGADVNTKSRDGQSALSLAEARMDLAFVEMLKHAGAK